MKRSHTIATIAMALACSSAMAQDKTAVAEVAPASGSKVSGTVTFTQKGDKILVQVKLAGLSALHGFHIHEKGDCSAPDGASAGAHFNPGAAKHGDRSDKTRHAGDLGNIAQAQPDAPAVEDSFEVSGITIGTGGTDDIVNRAVIVHAFPDDGRTQPTGGAGKRIGCGVIAIK